MATRKDLLKAQSFTSRRMIAAFVDRDPDDPTPPLRRVGTATFVSVLVGAVLLAGTTLIGLLRGGTANDSWKNEQNVILADVQSGALFAYTDDKVYPMADVASARLWAGGSEPSGQPRVVEIKTEALRDQQLEVEMGIPGAPRQLPASKDLGTYPVRLCSSQEQGAGRRYLSLEFGSDASSSRDFAIVARHSNGGDYLVYQGQTHLLYAAAGQQSSLIGNLPVITPGDGWIAALPAGAPIKPTEVVGYGDPGSDQLKIGKFAVVEDGEHDRYYIQLSGGLSRISYLEMKAIQHAHSDSTEPYPLTDVEVTQMQNVDQPTFTKDDIPLDEPASPGSVSAKSSVCAMFTEDSPERVSLSIDQPTPEIPSKGEAPRGQYVDLVDLPPLSGALLRDEKSAAKEQGAATLLLNGKAYFIPSLGARKALGYGDVTPLPVPGGLLNLLPPGLDNDGSQLSRDMIVPVE